MRAFAVRDSSLARIIIIFFFFSEVAFIQNTIAKKFFFFEILKTFLKYLFTAKREYS